MSNTVIRAENLRKKYVLSYQKRGQHYQSLRDVLADKTKSLGKKLLKPQQALNSNREAPLTLRDVSFEIKQGDQIGITGRIGSGKWVLLKILNHIIKPTTGSINPQEQIAAYATVLHLG